ncbi:Glyoxal oxidase [Macleaya cordata]|uniref:Glyoxal oxidase n=1 Tax=Macleaya cordata TaxID=56857 RepID=A0A200Q2T9_MACCD|nr:Glyoxal oxidase [Macleaya cordata]
METKSVLIFLSIFSLFIVSQSSQPSKGRWKLLKKSIGISAMHIQLLPNDRIITFDRTDFGSSNISLPKGKCRKIAQDQSLEDCSAHSIEFNPANRNVRPLTVLTDTWCSSGALAPDGVLVQSGGFNEGDRVVRYFEPCEDCDWMEDQNGLVVPRWYASNHILPNGKIIVVGGRQQFSYEFIPKSSSKSDYKVFELPFLRETKDSDVVENNLYPFLHLSTDGNLFIFANTRSILFDYTNNRVVRNYPTMPGGVSRNYPSTGSSVLLPLKLASITSNGAPEAEVFICGGTPPDSFTFSNNGTFLLASKSCGRLIITAKRPKWEMEEMPINRVMGDMILLPTGDVLIINGAKTGTAGWYVAREPVLNPVLYQPNTPNVEKSSRFEVMNPSKIARMYHSTAHLIPDGRVLVGGSNPNSNYNFTELFPTELSIEAFSPPYLSSMSRPKISWVKPGTELSYKQPFSIGFESKYNTDLEKVYVTMVAPSFNTHSFSMNQRLMVLDVDQARQVSGQSYVINGYAPATAYVAPPGYYLLFVVHCGVPSRGKWIHIS